VKEITQGLSGGSEGVVYWQCRGWVPGEELHRDSAGVVPQRTSAFPVRPRTGAACGG